MADKLFMSLYELFEEAFNIDLHLNRQRVHTCEEKYISESGHMQTTSMSLSALDKRVCISDIQ